MALRFGADVLPSERRPVAWYSPPVLLQAVPDSGNGADLIGIVALHVEGGKITLITYGGFYS